MKQIDHIDEQLMQLLEADARQTSRALAKQLGVSSATVRRRLKRLIDSEVLHMVAYRDPVKAGLPVAAVIGLNLDYPLARSAIQALRSHPAVALVSSTTGRFDAFAFARFSSHDELASFLRNGLTRIEGIRDSETFVCLRVEKPGVFC